MIHFNLAAINFVWLPILPMVIVAVAAMVVLLVGVRIDDSESEGLGPADARVARRGVRVHARNRRAKRHRFRRRDFDRQLFGVFSSW